MKTTKERVDNIETKLIAEKRRRSKRNKIILSICSCAATLIIVFSLVLFLPFPTQSIAQYQDSEYYPLICKLDGMNQAERKYKNNFEKLSASLSDLFGTKKGFGAAGDAVAGGDMVEWDAPSSPSVGGDTSSPSVGDEGYVEVTNNQVEGVREGDLFKRSKTNLYYLVCENEHYRLDVYPIAGTATQKSAELKIAPDKNMRFAGYGSMRELYLNADATRAYVLSPSYDTKNGILYTAVIGISLDGDTMSETGRVYVSGDYISSRFVDGKLLIVSNFTVRKFSYGDEKNYLPQAGRLGSFESVAMDKIVIPEAAETPRYTVLCTVEPFSLEVADSTALLSYSDEIYVSENHIFATLNTSETETTAEGDMERTSRTVISCLTYSPAFELKGTVNTEGVLNDRYSLDEHENVLRVFTTTQMKEEEGDFSWRRSSASLFCYSLEDFSLIAEIKNFAPKGETVRSARFQGDTAYVCTAVELTDPVFAFDLSDYQNISYKDTGTITGYSLYLTPFSYDTLLGIGINENRMLKIELYSNSGDNMLSLARYEPLIWEGNFSNQFKAYHIDKENGTIGLAVYDHVLNKPCYLLMQYDGYNIVLLNQIDISNNDDRDEARGTVIDGVFYLLCSQSGLYTLDIS